MAEPAEYVDFAARTGISESYAHEILNGKRTPSRRLAISIYRKTGRKLGPIDALSDDDIDVLERIEGAQASTPADQERAA
jgi:transcriptional regulator with XRE-family HTH domain